MSGNGASGGPPPTADSQDPLPEASWLWRRIFVFLLTAGLLAYAFAYTHTLGEVAVVNKSETAVKGLVTLLRISHIIIGGLVLFYLLAPSAEQLTKLIQTARSLRSGVAFKSTQTASTASGDRASSTSIAGPAVLPPKSEQAPDGASNDPGLPGQSSTGLPWHDNGSE